MRRLRLVLFLLVVSAAEADTVTARDSSSWNGRVTISADGVLNLVANFRTGEVTLTFGANNVRSIQFNPTVYNPGSDPTSLLPKKPNGGRFSGTIYMQNTSKSCGSITVDRVASDLGRVTVSCDGKSIPGVIRILVNNTQ